MRFKLETISFSSRDRSWRASDRPSGLWDLYWSDSITKRLHLKKDCKHIDAGEVAQTFAFWLFSIHTDSDFSSRGHRVYVGGMNFYRRSSWISCCRKHVAQQEIQLSCRYWLYNSQICILNFSDFVLLDHITSANVTVTHDRHSSKINGLRVTLSPQNSVCVNRSVVTQGYWTSTKVILGLINTITQIES